MEIILKAVSKKIGYTQVLDNINCLFLGGKIYGIVGYNGSGKTMLLRAICGLIFPDSGKVIIDGKQLHKDISFPESCGIIIENTDLLLNFSAFDNLKMLSEIKNTANDNMIKSAIKSVGLDPDSKKKVKTFSLGMKQRLSIAQALFEDPDILLLDEPTNALDEDGVNDVRRILLEQKKKNKLIIIASHNKEDISLLSDTVISVSNGRFQRK